MQELDINSIALISGGEIIECHCMNDVIIYLENQSLNVAEIDPKKQCEDLCENLGSSYKKHKIHKKHRLCEKCGSFVKTDKICICFDSEI